MPDVFSRRKRSEVMSKIRSKYSRLDRKMEELLRASGLEYEMYPRILGNPDFLVSPNLAVFCDSSFWHGRDWKRLRKKLLRSPRPKYWVDHILRNRRRDRTISKKLRQAGYIVIRFWDDQILEHPEECIDSLRSHMT